MAVKGLPGGGITFAPVGFPLHFYGGGKRLWFEQGGIVPCELSNWSLNIGLWGGGRIRLHASFLVVSVLGCYLAHLAGPRPNNEVESTVYGLLASAILLMCVIVHEFGHGLAAWYFGGSLDLVVLGPLGGMNPPHVPRETLPQVITALAGPLANIYPWSR